MHPEVVKPVTNVAIKEWFSWTKFLPERFPWSIYTARLSQGALRSTDSISFGRFFLDVMPAMGD